MGTTPIFGFPYPDPSDLVANYPATAQQLAEDVEDAIYDRKILQIVRATDTTNRSSTSTSYVDVTGMSITITPQYSDSALLIASYFEGAATTTGGTTGNAYGEYQITDSSNNAIGGQTNIRLGNIWTVATNVSNVQYLSILAYATPATTSPVTYKLRFKAQPTASVAVNNAISTGQMYAIEVSA